MKLTLLCLVIFGLLHVALPALSRLTGLLEKVFSAHLEGKVGSSAYVIKKAP